LSVSVGLVEPAVHAEFPGLRLHWTALEATVRASPREVERRLRELSDRVRGAGVVTMRTKPIPHAYRSFFRQVGLDPDLSRIPSEEAAVRRLLHGRFRSRDTLQDARLIALVETGVPVWALDAGVVDADSLGIRNAAGRLVVADSARVHATLFDEPEPGHVPSRGTRRMVLFVVGVEGVPAIHLEEALWMAREVLGSG
jgi:DNA/RNA-binding domain of Phe-tRNA-synthetase-like protein